MKRSLGQTMKEAFSLMWKDIKDYKWMLITIAGYFFVIWKFFRSSCILVELTGFPCPACGLTRAGLSVVRGDLHTAWSLHPFIFLVILLAIAAIIKRYFLKQTLGSLKKWLIILLAGLLVFYIYRMIRYFPGDPPISYYRNNFLRMIFSLYRNR